MMDETRIVQDALDAAGDICRRYEISSLEDFLESCRAFDREKTLNIAILGRFKAGKSSFLNQLLGRPLLPVGVIPVTSASKSMARFVKQTRQTMHGPACRIPPPRRTLVLPRHRMGSDPGIPPPGNSDTPLE